jgi:hypothetical protein
VIVSFGDYGAQISFAAAIGTPCNKNTRVSKRVWDNKLVIIRLAIALLLNRSH